MSHVRSPAPESVFKRHRLSGRQILSRSVQFRSGFPASCAIGLLLTGLGYFAVVLARGAANSAFGRAATSKSSASPPTSAGTRV